MFPGPSHKMFAKVHVIVSGRGRVRVRERDAAGFEDEEVQAAPRKGWRKRESRFSGESPDGIAAPLVH